MTQAETIEAVHHAAIDLQQACVDAIGERAMTIALPTVSILADPIPPSWQKLLDRIDAEARQTKRA